MPHLDKSSADRPPAQDFSWALPARILLQLNMHGFDLSVYHFQSPDRSWQRESLWARRAGIEPQRLAEPFNFRLMRVTKDADVWLLAIQEGSPALRELPAFIQNMTHGDAAMLWNDHELTNFGGTVQRKVSSVYGKDAPNPLTFCHRH